MLRVIKGPPLRANSHLKMFYPLDPLFLPGGAGAPEEPRHHGEDHEAEGRRPHLHELQID